MMNRTVAIFVDAGFFNRLFTSVVDPDMTSEPSRLAKEMWHYWIKHVDRKNGEQLYRIYFYDCPPLNHKVHHPITNKLIDFSKSDITKYKTELHEALLRQPYVACRMGQLSNSDQEWGFIRKDKVHSFKKLIRGDVDPKDINPDNVSLRPRQKGVDMKLGVDITSVVLKKLANKIVLISGDSDFVPAAKLARIEGAHFILDAMGRKVNGDLAEHIDGLKTFVHSLAKPKKQD
ncbi:NYN domain-containing protein [Pseudoalteromonas sp. JC28]|uniref:NYN domain-containing protein n=1 Tax=Pseudoalteromonas sp. JC28 TaxID=2267617 RepID=UPI00157354C1|nr:NYN domain-containing protein [Pseudoalteromonas sp. JC28]NSY34111.1 NYN domain-containing protein [Pseudoalteromonas sp. JC28]